jgi:hypothetical protein
VITSAALCPGPPLLVRELTGADPVLPELRAACAEAVATLLRDRPDVVAVVGPGPVTGPWPGDGRLNVAAFGGLPAAATSSADPHAATPDAADLHAAAPNGAAPDDAAPHAATSDAAASDAAAPDGADPHAAAPDAAASDAAAPDGADARPALPPGPGIGAYLLDQAGYHGKRLIWSVSADEPVAGCRKLGADLAGRDTRTGLLVIGDGSARRGPRAPGHFDERAAAFDAAAQRAVRVGDTRALLDLDPGLARDLMATGRAAWQVLAGALEGGTSLSVEVPYAGDPFGVAYLVATLRPSGAGRSALRG